MVNTMQLRNFDKPKTLPSCLPDDVPHMARTPIPVFLKPTLDEWHKSYSDDEARFRREVRVVKYVNGKPMYELFTGETVTPEEWRKRGQSKPADTPEAAAFRFVAQWYLSHPELLKRALGLPEAPNPRPPKAEQPAPFLRHAPMVLDRALSAQWLKDFKTAHTAVSSSPALQLLVKRGSEYPLREPIALEAIAA